MVSLEAGTVESVAAIPTPMPGDFRGTGNKNNATLFAKTSWPTALNPAMTDPADPAPPRLTLDDRHSLLGAEAAGLQWCADRPRARVGLAGPAKWARSRAARPRDAVRPGRRRQGRLLRRRSGRWIPAMLGVSRGSAALPVDAVCNWAAGGGGVDLLALAVLPG